MRPRFQIIRTGSGDAIYNGLTAVPETRAFLHGEKVAFGVLVQLVMEGQPHSVMEEVLRFSTSVGLPVTLAEIGLEYMTPDMLNRISVRSTAKGETIHNEPFEVTPEMVVDPIRAADAVGHAWQHHHAQ